MSKSRIFACSAAAFSAGVLAASLADIRRDWIYDAAAFCLCWSGVAFRLKDKRFAWAGVFLLAACAGSLRLQQSLRPSEYESYFDQKAEFEGMVSEEPDVRTDKQMLTVSPAGKNQEILITANLSKDYFYGDWVTVRGKITEPKPFEDFDYQKYLERYNIYAVIRYPERLLILKSHCGNFIKEQILVLKSWFIGRMFLVIPFPQSSLMAGILLGARRGLPQYITDNFNATGISHIVAISGYNITLIVLMINSLAKFLGRRASFYLGCLVLVSFIILTGGTASVIRASVMGFMVLLASVIGRQYRILPALLCAGFFMLLQNPRILFWDVGFQLSFMATLGIVLLMPHLETITKAIPSLFGARELLLTTFSAIAATMPLTLLDFSRLSLAAPLVNLLAIPVVPAVMFFGALSVLPVVGAGFAMPATWLLNWLLFISSFFARLRFSYLEVKIDTYIFCLLVLGQLIIFLTARGWALRVEGRLKAAVDSAARV